MEEHQQSPPNPTSTLSGVVADRPSTCGVGLIRRRGSESAGGFAGDVEAGGQGAGGALDGEGGDAFEVGGGGGHQVADGAGGGGGRGPLRLRGGRQQGFW